jgi:phosphate transport system substrate-binding protein
VSWGDVGVRDEAWSKRQITLFGMGPGSGSNGIVQDVVLLGGAFRTAVNEEPVSSSVIQAIAADPNAIGYSSAYFTAERTRQLELDTLDGSAFAAPTTENIRSGRYPLFRALRLYFVADPKRLSPATIQLMRFLVSQDGQELIEGLGQITLSPEQAHAEYAKTKP